MTKRVHLSHCHDKFLHDKMPIGGTHKIKTNLMWFNENIAVFLLVNSSNTRWWRTRHCHSLEWIIMCNNYATIYNIIIMTQFSWIMEASTFLTNWQEGHPHQSSAQVCCHWKKRPNVYSYMLDQNEPYPVSTLSSVKLGGRRVYLLG